MGEPLVETSPAEKPPQRWLDSWKAIAAYLNRDVTTVQRWEKREGMPVHRHVHATRGSVYAVPGELDAWIQSRSAQARGREKGPEPELQATEPPTILIEPVATKPLAQKTRWLALAAALSSALLLALWISIQHRPRRPETPQTSQIRSLAVLPFHNLSGEPAQDYLADGITEALIGRLSSIHDLRVISHTSVLRFKDPQRSVPEIVRELGVDAVVEGSVTRQGDRMRVTAQLIRGATDEHLWSETYDRQMRDALTLESELAQSIAQKVQVTVTGEEHERLSSATPVAPEVYELYLKGRFALDQGNTAGVDEAIRDFHDAVNRDATFAPAFLGLAMAYTRLGTIFAGVPPGQTRPQVIHFARQALVLDPNLADAHVVLANTLQQQWHWTEAEAEYRRALAINPNDAVAQAEFAVWLSCQGRTGEATAWIQRARALDPAGVSGADVSWILFQARRFGDAIREARSASAVQPNNATDLTGMAFPLIANNQSTEAIPVLEKSLSLSPGSPAVIGLLIHAYARAGRRDDALRLLADLKRRRETGYIPAGAFVNAYQGLGDKEQTFFWLEQAFREQSNILQFLKTHPFFDPIRDEPRFVALLHRVGLG